MKLLKRTVKQIAENKFDFADSCSMMQYYGKKIIFDRIIMKILRLLHQMIFIRCVRCWTKEEAQIYGLED